MFNQSFLCSNDDNLDPSLFSKRLIFKSRVSKVAPSFFPRISGRLLPDGARFERDFYLLFFYVSGGKRGKK